MQITRPFKHHAVVVRKTAGFRFFVSTKLTLSARVRETEYFSMQAVEQTLYAL